MAHTVFALDIHDDLVTGVLVRQEAKSLVVAACGSADVGLQSVETAVTEVIARVGYTEGECRVALGAEHFYYRNFNFPFTDGRKISKILPGELVENAPVEADRIMFDYLFAGTKEREAEIITAMAEKTYLAGQLQFLQGQSCDPEIIGISGTFGATAISGLAEVPDDYCYLDVGFRRAVLVLIVAGKIAVMRPLVFDTALQAGFGLTDDGHDISVLHPENLPPVFAAFVRTVRQAIQAARIGMRGQDLPLYLAGPLGTYPGLAEALRTALRCEVKSRDLLASPLVSVADAAVSCRQLGVMHRALALALAPAKPGRTFNFRKDAFRKKGSAQVLRKYTRRAAIPLAVLALLVVALLWRDHARLKEKQRALDAQVREVFTQTLPDVTRIVNPVQQIQVRIDEAKKAYMAGGTTGGGLGSLDLLAEISARIPAALQVQIVKLTADQSDVRLKGTTETFNIVDSIQKELEKSPYFSKVEISSANSSVKSGTIDFEIKLVLRQ